MPPALNHLLFLAPQEFEESRAVAMLKKALTRGGKAPKLTEVVISRQTLKEISGSLGARASGGEKQPRANANGLVQ